jgi:hypothetical protein
MIWLHAGQLLTTLVIGGIAALVAWRQWRTAQDKIKIDLFDRRFAVFMDVRKIVSEIGQRRKISDPGLINEVIARGRFLFHPDIHQQLEELHALCTRIETGDGKARSTVDAWFQRFIASLKPYMSMAGLKS